MKGADIRKAFRLISESQIYARGEKYYRDGCVGEWSVVDDGEAHTIIVHGVVSGTETYNVGFRFDLEQYTIEDEECDCPYSDVCKHIVALGLSFADAFDSYLASGGIGIGSIEEIRSRFVAYAVKQLNGSEPAFSAAYPLQEEHSDPYLFEITRLRRELKNLGLTSEIIPEQFLETLLKFKPATTPPSLKKAARTKKIDLSKYFVALEEYSSLAPTWRHKDHPHEYASVVNVLDECSELTTKQRELLLYIKKYGAHQHGERCDLAHLLPLLVESGIPAYADYYMSHSRPLSIDLSPAKLSATLSYSKEYVDYLEETRHSFSFAMPSNYFVSHDRQLVVQADAVVYMHGNTIELHRLSPTITKLVGRVEPNSRYDDQKRKWIQTGYDTQLTGEEVAELNTIIVDCTKFLDFSTLLTSDYEIVIHTKADPVLVVDYDRDKAQLIVTPVIDYGAARHDIAEGVYLSKKISGHRLARRTSFAHPGDHIIAVREKRIDIARFQPKEEFAFYKKLAAEGTDLGFTKTLKSFRMGNRKVRAYLAAQWPALSAYATKEQIPIVFTNDAIVLTQESFRADVAVDIRTDTDLLEFTTACYFGEERVTIAMLRDYLANSEPFFRKADGTLIVVPNREDIERFIRMIEQFRARENDAFEGRAYHASELEYVITSSPHYAAARTKSFNAFMKGMTRGRPVTKVRIPARLEKILRAYQKDGINWLEFLRSHRFAGILADDMGLGKTLETLAFLLLVTVKGKPSLVVCPKTLLYNWEREAAQFTPGLKVAVIDGSPSERARLISDARSYDLLITGYATMKNDQTRYKEANIRFNYCVLDEAQFIKNHATKNAQIVKQIDADYRLALTGTPIENSVSEIWSIFDFLMPGFLGSYETFAKRFHRPIMEDGNQDVLLHLKKKVECFMLRRTKGEVLKELPPKIEQVSRCHLETDQSVLYQEVLSRVRSDIEKVVEEKGFKHSQIHILAGLTKLRQVCNHPALLTKAKDHTQYASAKLAMCMELVEEVVGANRKVLIFSQFTQMLDIIAKELTTAGITYEYLSGKTNNRQDVVDRFNTDPAVHVFLISIKAGGTGLNLTSADTVIIFDPWWNPSVENQAVDRAHRIGQTQSVNVYRLLTIGTIEEKIAVLQSKKKQLFDALVGESADTFKKLTWEDVRELFR